MISTTQKLTVRNAASTDIEVIRAIYKQGIEDRVATLDEEPKSEKAIRDLYDAHDDRFAVLVAERANRVVGWRRSIRIRIAVRIATLRTSVVYVDRRARGTGVGAALLSAIEGYAKQHDFHKIVLFTLSFNEAGSRLYRKVGYREVGIFAEQGRLDGRFVDVTAQTD